MDMMDNEGIVHHPESLMEVQISGLLICVFWLGKYQDINHTIFWALMIEHIFSYVASYIRKWEINKYGEPDFQGVLRAPIESMCATAEVLGSSIIFGGSIAYFLIQDAEVFHTRELVYFNYWIIFDNLMMILTQGYVYFAKFKAIVGDIHNNFFTLVKIQERKLVE